MNSDSVQYTRDYVVSYLKDLIAKSGVVPTRDSFRETSDIPERAWRKFFSTYTEYVEAATIVSEELDNQVVPVLQVDCDQS